MSRTVVHIWLLNKRLLKKPSFISILVISLLFVLVFSFFASSDNAILTVAVASESPDEHTYSEILDSLNSGGMISFVQMSVQDAVNAVEFGKADAAWLFPADLDERIRKYVNDVNEDNYVVSVIQREESVLLQLSREKLMAAVYPVLSFNMYSEFVDLRYPSLADIKTEDLQKRYDTIEAEGADMFRIVTSQGVSISTEQGILLAPVRGILAVLAVIAGLAASLFSIRDEREGCFDMIPEKKRFGVYLTYNFVAVFDVAFASAAALAVSGLFASPLLELVLFISFVFSCVALCTVLRVIFRSERLFGILIPVLAVLMITVCPVFINVSAPLWFKLLLPPYAYIAGVYSPALALYSMGISIVLYFAAAIVFKTRKVMHL